MGSHKNHSKMKEARMQAELITLKTRKNELYEDVFPMLYVP